MRRNVGMRQSTLGTGRRSFVRSRVEGRRERERRETRDERRAIAIARETLERGEIVVGL